MKKICRWACRHRAGLLALAVGFAAWGLFYVARRSTAASNALAPAVSRRRGVTNCAESRLVLNFLAGR